MRVQNFSHKCSFFHYGIWKQNQNQNLWNKAINVTITGFCSGNYILPPLSIETSVIKKEKKPHINLPDRFRNERASHYFPQKYPHVFVGITESIQSKYCPDLMQLTLRKVTPDSHPILRWCIFSVCYNVSQVLKYIYNLTIIFHLRNLIGVYCYASKYKTLGLETYFLILKLIWNSNFHIRTPAWYNTIFVTKI